jgi:hypothetical protein
MTKIGKLLVEKAYMKPIKSPVGNPRWRAYSRGSFTFTERELSRDSAAVILEKLRARLDDLQMSLSVSVAYLLDEMKKGSGLESGKRSEKPRVICRK